MGRSGSEGKDRSPGTENHVRKEGGSGSASADAGGETFGWWDWRDHVEDLDDSVRPVAEALAGRVEGRTGPDELARTLAERESAGLRESWEAVSRLHRSLDRCRESAPPEEFSRVRERLDDACGELWVSGARAAMCDFQTFVREVAHDLRSPLHSIIFLTDALFREESGSLTGTQKRQVSVVHSAAAALLRMANDLLDFSGTAGEPDPDDVEEIPFSPMQVVDDLESLLEPVTHHHNARLDTELQDPESRVGDPQVLNRILLNLTSNAMEAAGENGTVRVRIAGDEDHLRAVVEDDSDDADLGKIRELVDGGSYPQVIRRLGGETRGLGLVICGRMVRAVDGDLDVDRTDDGWTRFSVELPFPVLETEDA